MALFRHLRECSGCGVDDEATDNDIVGYKRMIFHSVHRSPYALLGVAKAVEPLAKIDVLFHFSHLISCNPLADQMLHGA